MKRKPAWLRKWKLMPGGMVRTASSDLAPSTANPMKRLDPLAGKSGPKKLLPSERLGVPPTTPDVDVKLAAIARSRHLDRITPVIAGIRNGTVIFLAQQEAAKALLGSRSGVLPKGPPDAAALKGGLLAWWLDHPEIEDWRDAWVEMRKVTLSPASPVLVPVNQKPVPMVCAQCGCDAADPLKARHQPGCMSEETLPDPHPPHIQRMIGLTAKRKLADKAMTALRHFIGRRQRAAILDGMRGEEGEWFMDRMIALAGLIAGMPATYGQDGLGGKAVVSLHYFAGGSANWWITEKDRGGGARDKRVPENGQEGSPDDLNPGEQQQAFGLANLFGGPSDQDAELGYISIAEIIGNHGEIDLHFEPRTLDELKAQDRKANEPPPLVNVGAIFDRDAEPDRSKVVDFPTPPKWAEQMAALRMPE